MNPVVPKVSRIVWRCDRCGESDEKLYIVGVSWRLCRSCVAMLVRVALA